MSARRPVTSWQGKWNRGTMFRPAGRIAASVDITISPTFMTNTHTFFPASIGAGEAGAITDGTGIWTVVSPETDDWAQT